MLIYTAVLAVVSAASVTLPVSETVYVNETIRTRPGSGLPPTLLTLVPKQVNHSPSSREIIGRLFCWSLTATAVTLGVLWYARWVVKPLQVGDRRS